MSKKEKKPRGGLPPVIEYRDERNDEFSTAVITPRRIDSSYRYERSDGWHRPIHLFWYRVVATPLAFLYLKLKFRHKIVGRKAFKATKKMGCFFFGNHTQIIGDALIPTFVSFPTDAYVIVHPNNVSMPVLGRITPWIGALPLPDDKEAARNFMKIIEKRIAQKKAVFVYPEAHIWPYYTKIRPFPDDAFSYPIKYGTPVFCFTNTYQKRKRGKSPQLVTYVDGPFYPNEDLPLREKRRDLRDRVYACMVERSRLSDCVVIEYRRASDSTPNSERT